MKEYMSDIGYKKRESQCLFFDQNCGVLNIVNSFHLDGFVEEKEIFHAENILKCYF